MGKIAANKTPDTRQFPHPMRKDGRPVPFNMNAEEYRSRTIQALPDGNHRHIFYTKNNSHKNPIVTEIVAPPSVLGGNEVLVEQTIGYEDEAPTERLCADPITGRITQVELYSGNYEMPRVVINYAMDKYDHNKPSSVEVGNEEGLERFAYCPQTVSGEFEECFDTRQVAGIFSKKTRKHFYDTLKMVDAMQGNGFTPANVPASVPAFATAQLN